MVGGQVNPVISVIIDNNNNNNNNDNNNNNNIFLKKKSLFNTHKKDLCTALHLKTIKTKFVS